MPTKSFLSDLALARFKLEPFMWLVVFKTIRCRIEHMNSLSHLFLDPLRRWVKQGFQFLFVCSRITLWWQLVESCQRWGKPRSLQMLVRCWILPRINGCQWMEWKNLELRLLYAQSKIDMFLPLMAFWRAQLELIASNILTWVILTKVPSAPQNGWAFQSRIKISSWTSHEVAHTTLPTTKSSSSVEYATNASTWTSPTSRSLLTANLNNKAGPRNKSPRCLSTFPKAQTIVFCATQNSVKIQISLSGHSATTSTRLTVR